MPHLLHNKKHTTFAKQTMRKELQKYLSLALCILLLFPMVERQIHAFEHIADKHCTANEKHFHEQEHHCTICDFTLTDSSPNTNADYKFIASAQKYTFAALSESVHSPGAFCNLPARAPPVA